MFSQRPARGITGSRGAMASSFNGWGCWVIGFLKSPGCGVRGVFVLNLSRLLSTRPVLFRCTLSVLSVALSLGRLVSADPCSMGVGKSSFLVAAGRGERLAPISVLDLLVLHLTSTSTRSRGHRRDAPRLWRAEPGCKRTLRPLSAALQPNCRLCEKGQVSSPLRSLSSMVNRGCSLSRHRERSIAQGLYQLRLHRSP